MTAPRTARALIPAAAAGFARRVHQVQPDRWSAPTPCADWSVRDLVNHLTGEHLWAPHLLRGATVEQVGDRYDGDILGDDPVAALDAAVAESLPAFAAVDDDTLVHLSFGDVPASEYAEQMLLDLTVHAWDLARGAGLDERLSPAAVEHVAAYTMGRSEFMDDWRSSGLFAAELELGSGDPQERLLAFLGRRS